MVRSKGDDMAIRLFSKPAATMGKMRSMTVAPLAIVATLMASVAAHALEINSAIKKWTARGPSSCLCQKEPWWRLVTRCAFP